MIFSNNRKLLDSLLWGITVGYPGDSLACCFYRAMLRRAIATDRRSVHLCVTLRYRGHGLATAWLLVVQRFKLFYFPSLLRFFNVYFSRTFFTSMVQADW